MIPEPLRQQIDQWLDGDLPSEEECHLQQSLESMPEALEFLADRALLHQMLAKSIAFDLAPSGSIVDHSLINASSDHSRRHRYRWFMQPWAWASSALLVGLMLISLILMPKVVASPAELVQKTLLEHQSAIDRCYTAKVELEGRLRRNVFSRRAVPWESTLWVRDDRFVQIYDSEGDTMVWGRNAQGAVWFTISGRAAAIFEADEIPDLLQEVCDLRTLQLPTLLESLLHDYDLQYMSRENGDKAILARPSSQTGNAKFGTVEIEIDPQSLLVRRVTLERINDHRPVALVSFSLERLQPRDDSLYELEGHLQAGALTLDRRAAFGKRSALLREFLLKLRSPQAAQP